MMGRTKTQDAFSITGASDILNRATRTISKALQRSGDKPTVNDHGTKKWPMRVIVAALDKYSEAPITATNASAGPKTDRLDLSSERAKLAIEQTEAAKLKNKIAAGQFVPVKVVVDMLDQLVFRSFRNTILAMLGKIADRVSTYSSQDRTEIFEIIERECHQALTLLSTKSFWDDVLASATIQPADDSEGKATS
jgi:phage terminase Nu1 subunit (DNA packaging protein)